MRNLLLALLAFVLILILALPAIIIQIIRFLIIDKELSSLWWSIAIGLDQLGGSIIYGEPDWTISSRTFYLSLKGNIYAEYLERFINLMFGKNHCEASYRSEFGGS